MPTVQLTRTPRTRNPERRDDRSHVAAAAVDDLVTTPFIYTASCQPDRLVAIHSEARLSVHAHAFYRAEVMFLPTLMLPRLAYPTIFDI
jgi:hypothetical protein